MCIRAAIDQLKSGNRPGEDHVPSGVDNVPSQPLKNSGKAGVMAIASSVLLLAKRRRLGYASACEVFVSASSITRITISW